MLGEKSGIGVIVAAHGGLGEALVKTAGMILDQPPSLCSFAFEADEAPQLSAGRLKTLIRKCDEGRGVIILADLFGGTPGALALSMLVEEQVEVLTGVNLAMALAAACLPADQNLSEACAAIIAAGRESIKAGGMLLKS